MKHTLEVTRTAHYYHEPSRIPAKGIVIAIHGYAQLASDFIKDFNELTEAGFHVYAPEALSKFYNRDRKPVANWMTSQHRESEIRDYILYLEKVLQQIKKTNENLPVHLIGFSQGVSTTLRWYASSDLYAASIHLVAGSIPEELNKTNCKALASGSYHYYHGIKDKLVPQQQADLYLSKLSNIGIRYKSTTFNGRHEIPAELLLFFNPS